MSEWYKGKLPAQQNRGCIKESIKYEKNIQYLGGFGFFV